MYQKIIVVGNLGQDPEMRYMPDGSAVTNFSVATNRRWTSRETGDPVDETTWFRVSVWGKQAEACNEYLSKGSKVLVEGSLKPDPNTGGPHMYTRQDGTVGASFQITASTVRFLSSKEESAAGGGQQSQSGYAQEEDEIPF